MLKDRLKELDIKITELADYLNISRPTLYKFIEYYDNDNKKEINKSILKLFNYINNNELIGKNNVISYILNNLAEVNELENKEEVDYFRDIRKYILNNPDSEKSIFLNIASKKNIFDPVIHYLIQIMPLIGKKKVSAEESDLIKPYQEIIKIYKENMNKKEK